MSDFLTWVTGAFFGWYCAKWAYAYSGWKQFREEKRREIEQRIKGEIRR